MRKLFFPSPDNAPADDVGEAEDFIPALQRGVATLMNKHDPASEVEGIGPATPVIP